MLRCRRGRTAISITMMSITITASDKPRNDR
jgi:hypothetical protein